MFSAGNLREWRGRFFRPVGWPCRPRCTLAELYLQLQRGESVSLHFFRKAKPLPMDNLRKSGVERELSRACCCFGRWLTLVGPFDCTVTAAAAKADFPEAGHRP